MLKTALPAGLGAIADLAPIDGSPSSWLLLTTEGKLIRFDTESGRWSIAATASVPDESREPWCGRFLKRRLHVSRNGAFAAVVNDYGRYGQLIDLTTGKATLALNGGDYHSETVPFSFAFVEWEGRVLAIHRSDWNRLEVSDAATGELRSARGPTRYQNKKAPPHYLDYFHGALYLSPDGERLADDGWVWHPVGVVTALSVAKWLGGEVWESEDGASKRDLCARSYYWDHGVVWIDANRIAIEGIGDDDAEMVAGARILDVTASGVVTEQWRAPMPPDLLTLPGPAGRFFSDGQRLFSSDSAGLAIWDLTSGERIGEVRDFSPAHHHRGAEELVQSTGDALLRWSMRMQDHTVKSDPHDR